MKQVHTGEGMKPKGRNRKGFTLIELMVVILILAILAALIVPRLFGQQDKAKIAKAKSDITELYSALSRFRSDNDRFPTEEEGLNALLVAPSDVTGWKEKYVEKLPSDPWGDDYVYHNLGNNEIEVKSYGPDHAEGGGDDISSLDGTSATGQ